MPTCGVPVVDGQKRTLTLTIVLLWCVLCESVVRGGAGRAPTMRVVLRRGGWSSAEAGPGSGVRDRVRPDPDAVDGDVDAVAGHDLSDSGRGAGEDDVSGQQGDRLGQVLDESRDVEDEVGGGPVLLLLPVDPGPDADIVDVEFGFDPRAQRTGGVE